MLVSTTLLILFVLVIFNLVLGNNLLSNIYDIEIDVEAIVDGTPATYEIMGSSVSFGITELEGMIVLLIVIITIASIVGIQILGSGLSDSSVRTLTIVIFYAGLWTMLSALVFNLINTIEIFGYLIYITLTIAYVLGVFQKIQGD